MAIYTKTAAEIWAPQEVASGVVLISSAIDVEDKIAAMIYLKFGRRAATALTVGAQLRIETSSELTGDREWQPHFIYTTDIAAASDEAVSGAVAAGQKVITVAATAGFVAGDVIFISAASVGDSEWHRIKSIVSNTSVTVEDDLTNAATGATLFDQAQIFRPVEINCRAVMRIRVVADNTGSGQAVAVAARIVTTDGFA